MEVDYQDFKLKAYNRSSGSFLSNEVFYRVSWLRNNSTLSQKYTGHIHVGFLQGDPITDRNTMLTIIKNSITQALNNFTV